MNDIEIDFITELLALLKKYNATIGFTCSDGSDTMGLYNDGMYITLANKEILKTHDWVLDAYDMSQLLKDKDKVGE